MPLLKLFGGVFVVSNLYRLSRVRGHGYRRVSVLLHAVVVVDIFLNRRDHRHRVCWLVFVLGVCLQCMASMPRPPPPDAALIRTG